jgi:hypothetical protein
MAPDASGFGAAGFDGAGSDAAVDAGAVDIGSTGRAGGSGADRSAGPSTI